PGAKEKCWEDLALGAATGLVLSWQEPVGLPDAGPLRSARGQVVVRLEEQYLQAVAELTLQDLRARAREWKLWLPAQARVKVAAPEGVAYKLSASGPNLHTLQLLSEPTGEP